MKVTLQTSRLRQPIRARDIFLACLSGTLMALPFLNLRLWLLAWVALVPLLIAIRDKEARESFLFSYLAGVVFFSLVLHWLSSLVYWVGGIALVGLILLIFYLAVYWGLFGLLVWFGRARFGSPVWFTGAAVWVLLEYLESKLFTGFGWALVGYSQAYNRAIIQWASVGGVFLVSAIVVLSSTLIYSLVAERRRAPRLLATAIILAVVPLSGRFMRVNPAGKTMRVAVVQGNFWQDVIWSAEDADDSLFVYELLSSQAVRDGAELVIWPESAVPGYLELDARLKEEVQSYASRRGVHLLLGAKRAVQQPDWHYFNAAYLINDEGEIADRYDKMHLAPFGEYVPLRRILPFMAKLVPAMRDFSPGKTRTVFQLNDVKFGVLICFETVFPELARALGREQTNFLVTITNVAWYGRSAAAFQDLAICILRAVENRMWLVRAANSGISCFIDASGEITSMVEYEGEPVFVRGWAVEDISVGKRFSFYRRFGDLFAVASGAWVAIVALASWRRGRKMPLGEVRRYG